MRIEPILMGLALLAAPARADEIRFSAQVGGAPFACGQSYPNLGAGRDTATPTDYRLFVHDVMLLRADGSAVPFTLSDDAWQSHGVALLDFEDGSGPCAQGGNAAMNGTLRGQAPAGDYTGLRFTLGVPERLNHQDHTLAESPFNVTAMFWTWQHGYKFLKVDLEVAGGGFSLHLGSTQCMAAAPTQPGRDCRNPNRPVVTLQGFNPLAAPVVVDVAPVLAGVALRHNTPGTPAGCMGFPNDPECRSVMPALGLPYGGAPAGAQALFRAPTAERQAAR